MHKAVRGYIRKMTRAYLTSRCTVQTETVVRGDFGQNATYWLDVAVDMACRQLPAGQSDTERVADYAGQEAIDETYRLIVPHGFGLEVGQRVILDDKIFYVGSLLVGVTDEAFRACVIVRKAGSDG